MRAAAANRIPTTLGNGLNVVRGGVGVAVGLGVGSGLETYDILARIISTSPYDSANGFKRKKNRPVAGATQRAVAANVISPILPVIVGLAMTASIAAVGASVAATGDCVAGTLTRGTLRITLNESPL